MPEDKLSFIPQKNPQKPFYKKGGPGILMIVSFLLFLISILAYGGIFLYKNNLKKEVDTLASSLEQAKAAFEISLINEIAKTSERINISEKLLEKHTAVTPIFDLLERDTLKDVRLKSFKYSPDKSNLIVSIDGIAKDYSTLALQSDVFEQDKDIKSVSFSGLGLGEKGVVNFSASLYLDPSIILYKIE